MVRFVESESRPDDTLLAVGGNSAYIYFRSKVEPCHKLHWDVFFGWLAVALHLDIDTAMDAIVAKPPTWIAIDRASRARYLLHPDENREGIVPIGRLLLRLSDKYQYLPVYEKGRWTGDSGE